MQLCRPIPLTFLVALTLSSGATSIAEDDEQVAAQPRAIDIESLQNAADADAKEATFNSIFVGLSPAELKRLTQHEDDELACRAAWEWICALTVAAEKEGGNGFLSDEHVNWFVGYMEGRLRAPVPTIWVRWLGGMSTRWHKEKSNYGSCFGLDLDAPQRHPSSLAVDSQQESVPLQLGEPTKRYMKQLKLGTSNGWLNSIDVHEQTTIDEIFAVKLDGDCFLGESSFLGAAWELTRVNGETGESRWSAVVWAHNLHFFLGWAPGGDVELVLQGDRVFAFGHDYLGLYCEIFDAETGEARFRFSTQYVCDQFRPRKSPRLNASAGE